MNILSSYMSVLKLETNSTGECEDLTNFSTTISTQKWEHHKHEKQIQKMQT
jgi:hypothetical protein